MAEPRLVTERKSVNLSQKLGASDKKPSQRAVTQFNTQSTLIKNKTAYKARDSIANKLSTISANDGNYLKCSSTSGTPCVDTGGYEDKRAYSGSGMAGWKEAGLAGYTNKQVSAGAGVTADLFLFGIGASAEVAGRSHGKALCLDLTGCIQLGLGLHAGAGAVFSAGAEKKEISKVSTTVGGFGNFFATGGSANISDGGFSGGKGMLGAGAGASSGVQACATVSVRCKTSINE